MSTFSASDLAFLCGRMQQGLNAGLTPQKILASVGKRASLARLSQSAIASLNNGDSLHRAFSMHAISFPKFVLAVVEAGEESGRLPETFQRLAEYFRDVEKAQKEIRAKALPALMQVGLGFVVVMLTGLILFFLGKGAVAWLALSGFFVVMGLLVTIFLVWKFADTQTRQRLFQRIPGLAGVQRLAGLQRFCLVMGTTLDSSLNADRAVSLALDASDLASKEQIETISKKVKRGAELSVALGLCKPIPEELLGAIAVGESAGSLPETMTQQSIVYQELLQDKIKSTTRLATGALGVLVGLSIIVAIFVLAQDYLNALNG